MKLPYTKLPFQQTRVKIHEDDHCIVEQDGNDTFTTIKTPKELTYFWEKEPFMWAAFSKTDDKGNQVYGPYAWLTIPRRQYLIQRIQELRGEFIKDGKRYSKDVRKKLPGLLERAEQFANGKFNPFPDLFLSEVQKKELRVIVDGIAKEIGSLCSYNTKRATIYVDDWLLMSAVSDNLMMLNAGFSAD